MPLHTIAEAVKLTGKSRRTVYYYMDSGRISYSVGSDSRRYIETSELIRVFGEIKTECAILHTPEPEPDCTQTQLIAQLVHEVKQLRFENKEQAAQIADMAKRQAEELAAIRGPVEEPTKMTTTLFFGGIRICTFRGVRNSPIKSTLITRLSKLFQGFDRLLVIFGGSSTRPVLAEHQQTFLWLDITT